jgi:biopolymer transport protein ExbB
MTLRPVFNLIFACSSVLGVAVTADAAVNFNDLLQQTRKLRADEVKQTEQRVAKFRTQLAAQERRINEATVKRNAAEANSNALSRRFDENEAHIKELKLLLEQHQGNLGELFGVTRQIAGDAASVLQESMISVEHPAADGQEDRVAFLTREAGAKELPSIRELERIWYELLHEMTESGKVSRFTTDILLEDAVTTRTAEVVRIGPFTAVSSGEYFSYLPSRQMLSVLSGRIDSRLQKVAEDLTSAKAGDGYMPAVVDPASGALLSMYVHRPNMMERVKTGHLVGYIIITVGIIGAIVALIQYVYLFLVKIMVTAQLRDKEHPKSNNPLGRLLLAIKSNSAAVNESSEVIELRISEAVLREVPRLERFQAFLRLVVAAGPLLGLIGTVIGMIITFQSITASGASDPKLMANGIGQAMIATVLGLGIAIPLLFVNAGLASLSRSLMQVLDEHSTGLLADRIISKRR